MVEVKIKIDNIDYGGAVNLLIPILREKAGEHPELGVLIRLASSNMAAGTAKAAIKALPQNIKDELAVALANYYHEKIIGKIINSANKYGFDFEIEDFIIRKVN